MRDECFLVMSEHGIERMTKRSGKLNRGEVSVKLSIGIPDSVFVQPTMVARITIPESAVIHPPVEVQVFDATPAPATQE